MTSPDNILLPATRSQTVASRTLSSSFAVRTLCKSCRRAVSSRVTKADILSNAPYLLANKSSCSLVECHSRKQEAISSTNGSWVDVGVSSPILSIGTGAGGRGTSGSRGEREMGERGRASCWRWSERAVHCEPWLPVRFLVDLRRERGRVAEEGSTETESVLDALLACCEACLFAEGEALA